MKRAELIEKLANAIARMEGYTAKKGRGWTNKNPGNLRDVKLPGGRWWIWPALPHDDKGFPMFRTDEDGWAALRRDLGLKIDKGMTLEQLINAWAPPVENRTDVYLENVAAWTGLPTTKRIKDLIS